MYRDVTELLAVDRAASRPPTQIEALIAIRAGHRTVVADDATAVAVFEALGLTRSEAIDRVRASYGPMLDRSAAQIRHLDALAPTGWFRYRHPDGEVKVVARWYWPGASLVEGNTGPGWTERQWLLEIAEDAGWEQTDESTVYAWLAGFRQPQTRVAAVNVADDWNGLDDDAKDAAVDVMLTQLGRTLGVSGTTDSTVRADADE